MQRTVAVVRHGPATDGDDVDDAPDGDWARRHLLGVWRFARLVSRSAHLADDFAQDALLAALAKGVDRLPDAAARAWLREAVRNLWRMHCRSSGRRGARVDIELADLAWAENPDDDGTAWRDALAACLQRLPERTRSALQRRYGSGEDRESLAAALGLGLDGLKSVLQRGKELLRGCIERRLRGETAPESRP